MIDLPATCDGAIGFPARTASGSAEVDLISYEGALLRSGATLRGSQSRSWRSSSAGKKVFVIATSS